MSEFPTDDIDNIMTCAKWLVRELENINCQSLAKLFQKAVDDADIWILHMKKYGYLSSDPSARAMQKESELIRDLLVRYARITDPDLRISVIQGMISSLDLVCPKERGN